MRDSRVNGKINCVNADDADEPDDADRSVTAQNSG
jgi:hypothetical protein